MNRRPPPTVVAIGASAGGLEAVGTILEALPTDFAPAVLVVIHVPPNRPSMLADIFAHRCALPVHEAEDKQPLLGGAVYLAPPDYHLLLEHERALALSRDPPIHFSRPSIDALFVSVAESAGPRGVGVLLTGASSDGADGLRAIAAAGGRTAVEDPETAQVATMPRAALARMRPDLVAEVAGIAAWLCATAGARRTT